MVCLSQFVGLERDEKAGFAVILKLFNHASTGVPKICALFV